MYDQIDVIHFKSPTFYRTRPLLSYSPLYRCITGIPKPEVFNIVGGNYARIDDYIYISNDVYLGKFTLNLIPIKWTRGIFRFSNIKSNKRRILAGGTIYDVDFFRIGSYEIKNEELIVPHYGVIIDTGVVQIIAHLNELCEFIFTVV